MPPSLAPIAGFALLLMFPVYAVFQSLPDEARLGIALVLVAELSLLWGALAVCALLGDAEPAADVCAVVTTDIMTIGESRACPRPQRRSNARKRARLILRRSRQLAASLGRRAPSVRTIVRRAYKKHVRAYCA